MNSKKCIFFRAPVSLFTFYEKLIEIEKEIEEKRQSGTLYLEEFNNPHTYSEPERKKKANLILLDYLMPEMDGPETLKAIRADEDIEDVPVIFLTGVKERNIVIETITKLKPEGYVIKPSKKSELVAKIIDALE
ncbi:MAG: response regulator [Lachnospiraceae bacterium]|nr:response regulator [Lachnospiraceae bacterium]